MKTNPVKLLTPAILLSFIFLIISFPMQAQASWHIIKGKVIDKNTKVRLQGASVFAQNTTIGSATDAKGYFGIRLPEGGLQRRNFNYLP